MTTTVTDLNKIVGRIVFEMYNDVTPITCENFVTLSREQKYKNCVFHRVIKDFMVQSGDYENNDGTGGKSIYGEVFDDENFQLPHDRPFLLSMANKGMNSNGSQFFITTNEAPHLNGIHVVFGHVISGKEIVTLIENQPVKNTDDFEPASKIVISNCGELVKKMNNNEKKEEINSNISEEDEEESDESDEKEDSKETSKKYIEKLQKLSKRFNMPLEVLGFVPVDTEDIPETPKNPLKRNILQNLLEGEPARVSKKGRVRGRGNVKYSRHLKNSSKKY